MNVKKENAENLAKQLSDAYSSIIYGKELFKLNINYSNFLDHQELNQSIENRFDYIENSIDCRLESLNIEIDKNTDKLIKKVNKIEEKLKKNNEKFRIVFKLLLN